MTAIHKNIQKLDDQMRNWRHDLHRHPELGFEETRTAGFVASSLKSFGLEVVEGFGDTGVIGILKRGSSSNAIGMRADMDALQIQEQNEFDHKSIHDGKMHACGHDGHTAMLLGAAKALSENGQFDGTAYFVFQPAEEHGKGALGMIADGLFEKFPMNAIYAMHNMPSIPTGHVSVCAGPIMACEDNFVIKVKGKGTHAALPHLGIDPIVIGSEIVLALQTIIAREFNPLEKGVVSVTNFEVDGTRNVIPNEVILRGDTRSFGPEIQQQIEDAMHRIVKGICSAHRAEYEFSYSREFAATINTKNEAEIAANIAKKVIGEDQVNDNCPPVMASEDFGFMLQHKQGCYFFLGNGGDGPGGCGLHSPNYDFNDEILSVGAQIWYRLVEDQLPLNNS